MRIVALVILSALAFGTDISTASAQSGIDGCIARCMERGCTNWNGEGPRCWKKRRPGCIRECERQKGW